MPVERIGPYRIESFLGQGGMGEVFLACDEKLRRQVAIKRIRADLPLGPSQRARFRREALAAARLSHPSIVHVYELLETPEGDCLVMERVDGSSLAELLASGGLELRQVLRLGRQIAEGLAEAHAKGLIHRDLKPENVLVTRGGHAKIVDFGLARMLWNEGGDDPSGSGSGLTEAGLLVGTVHAMSPEQASGQEVDHRSDLFALGGLLYEMASGRAPFRGDNWLDSLRRVNGETPVPLLRLRPELPPALVELVDQLLAKKKEGRPANARLVAEALERIALAPPPAAIPGVLPAAELVPPAAEAAPALGELATGAWSPPAAARGQTALRALLRWQPRPESAAAPPAESARRATESLRELRRLRELVAQHGGIEVEKGEAVLALFERPADAVACALALQRGRGEAGPDPGKTAFARIGIHFGEVLLVRPSAAERERGARPVEVEGAAKEMAARLAGLAGEGQILLTQGAFDLARRAAAPPSAAARQPAPEEDQALAWLAHGAYFFSAVEERTEIFEVGWRELAPLAPPADGNAARRMLSPSEERMLGWRPAAGQPIPLRPHWQLLARIGEGGFGEVWLARHKSGEKRVFKFCFEAARLRALKREVTLFRLLKEALGHRDDIARILDWQFDEAPFFVESEYTEAGNLAQWAEQQGGIAGVPPRLRLALAAEVAEALAAAHSVGILHKDVKPENVLIGEDREGRPRARLSDFGIGHLSGRERLAEGGLTPLGFSATLGTEGSGTGTLGYLAPELVEGKAATVQADIYSLGVLVYQLAVGDLKRMLAPGWERDVGDELLAEDIAAFVDGRPERRPASAREVAERLRTLEPRRAERDTAAARRRAFDKAQHRRRVASAVAALALGVLAIVSVMAVRELRARKAAEQAERRATLRQGQAEELIDFMLGDLRQKLDGVGRLDVLEAVGAQAMEYFAAVPAAELSDSELARRSKALYQIGEVRVNQGQLPAAREAFQQAVRLSEALVARAPENESFAFELAQSRFWLGSVDWDQGEIAGALENFRAYLEIAEENVARAPKSDKWTLEVAYALTSLAAVLYKSGDAEGAERDMRRAVRIKQELVVRSPEDRELRISLANGLAWLASMSESHGLLAQSVAAFTDERTLRERILAGNPHDVAAQEALATCLGNLGRILFSQGDPSALRTLRAQWELLESLVTRDSENRNWQRSWAVASTQLGEAFSFSGEPGSGAQLLRHGEKLLANLTRLDPSNEDWQQELAISRLRLAEASLRNAKPREAARQAREVLVTLAPVSGGKPTKSLLVAAAAQLVLGSALEQLSEKREAKRAWETAYGTIGPLTVDSRDLTVQDLWARVLFHLGHRAAAAATAGALRAGGYGRPDFDQALIGIADRQLDTEE